MRWMDGWILALGMGVVLAGGCETSRLPAGTAGLKPVAPYAGVPMAFSTRVVGDKRPDFYSFKTLLASPPFRGLQGADLARAWSNYFTSAQDGCTYLGCVTNMAGGAADASRPTDPLRLLNAYGWLMDESPEDIWTVQPLRGQTMDFVLRPGETLIRSQRCEGLFPGPAHGLSNARALHVKANSATHTNDAACRTCGHGRWIYEPNLRVGYMDFAAGVRDRRGITQTAEGLRGAGQCTIPFVSTYPFVSRPDIADGTQVCQEGALITLCASGDVKIEVSDPYGLWTPVPVQATNAEETINIGPLLEARCAFDIRLTLGANARVSKFRFEGFLLTAPMTIPRLDEGLNVMTMKTKDTYGLATVPYEIIPDFRQHAAVPLDQQAAIRNGALRPGSGIWQLIAPQAKGTVRATFRFEAPAGEAFAWFYVRVFVIGTATGTPSHVKLDWSGNGGVFRSLAAIVDNTASLCRGGCLDAEQILDQPGPTVQVRVTSSVPISGLEFVGHLDRGAALATHPEVTHRWIEGRAERLFRAPSSADRYYFRCGPKPTGHMVEMKMPSVMIPVVNHTWEE